MNLNKVNELNELAKQIRKDIDADIDTDIDKKFNLVNHHLSLQQMIANSIARLLDTKKYVCTAAIFVNKNSESFIYMSSNKIGVTTEYQEKANNLIGYFKNDLSIKILTKSKIDSIKQSNELIISEFSKQLTNVTGNIDASFINEGELIIRTLEKSLDSLYELIKSNKTDDTYIEKVKEISTFLCCEKAIIFFKTKDSKKFLDMIFKSLLDINYILFDIYLLKYFYFNDVINGNIPIPTIKIIENPEKVHCELKLVFDLLKDEIKNWSYIGVSKLCCPLCAKNLECIQTHGNKQISYSGRHNGFRRSLGGYKLPASAGNYSDFLVCFEKWIKSVSSNTSFNELCNCSETSTIREHSQIYTIEGYTQSQDMCFFGEPLCNDKMKFLTDYSSVQNLIICNNIILGKHPETIQELNKK